MGCKCCHLLLNYFKLGRTTRPRTHHKPILTEMFIKNRIGFGETLRHLFYLITCSYLQNLTQTIKQKPYKFPIYFSVVSISETPTNYLFHTINSDPNATYYQSPLLSQHALAV
jgi:hypothetical protein